MCVHLIPISAKSSWYLFMLSLKQSKIMIYMYLYFMLWHCICLLFNIFIFLPLFLSVTFFFYSINRWTNECPSQVIIPTSRFEGSEHPLKAYPSVHIVQYSDHCSYKELCQFVELVKPVSIHPVVQRDKVCNVSCFEHLLSSRKMVSFVKLMWMDSIKVIQNVHALAIYYLYFMILQLESHKIFYAVYYVFYSSLHLSYFSLSFSSIDCIRDTKRYQKSLIFSDWRHI